MTSETEETVLDLLPCPFCGAGVRLLSVETWSVQPDDYHSGYVTCQECDAQGARPEQWLGDKASADEAARIAWNTRAALSRAPEVEDRHADEKQEVVASLYKAWPDAEDIPSDWPLGIIGCIEQIISERDEALAALSPPSTGGEGEAVAWRCLNVHGDAFLTEDANGAHFWLKSGKPVQPLYLHPSPEMGEISREVEDAFRALLRYAEINTCQHEETKRGGTIWTICCDCGRRWADDEGGFQPYVEPPAIAAARTILSKLKENGLSREGLGGSARAGSGAACPSDCAEGDAHSDLEQTVCEALQDSLGPDWSAEVGARYVIDAIRERG